MFVERGQRSVELEMARGIGILLVVAGHCFDGPVQSAIYLFHMPLFFFLAGLVGWRRPVMQVLGGRTRRLIIPTLCYAICIACFALLWRGPLAGNLDPVSALREAYDHGYFVVFWFPVVLVASELLLSTLLRLGRYFDLSVLLCLFSSYGLAAFGMNTPLSVLSTLHAVALLRVGLLLAESRIAPPKAAVPLLGGLGIFGVAAAAVWPVLSYNMKEEMYGVPFASLLLSAACTLAVLTFCTIVKRWPLLMAPLSWLGASSMAIMFLHQPVQIALADLGLENDLGRFTCTCALSIALVWLLSAFKFTRSIFLGNRRVGRQSV